MLDRVKQVTQGCPAISDSGGTCLEASPQLICHPTVTLLFYYMAQCPSCFIHWISREFEPRIWDFFPQICAKHAYDMSKEVKTKFLFVIPQDFTAPVSFKLT